MTQQVVKVAKKGKSAFSTDPNDFVFHSAYNTFKIVEESTRVVTLAASTNNQSFTQIHSLDYIPIATAFAKRDAASQVFAPNGIDIEIWSGKGGMSGYVTFNYVQTSATNIVFNFDNTKGSTIDLTIRYFLFEKVA